MEFSAGRVALIGQNQSSIGLTVRLTSGKRLRQLSIVKGSSSPLPLSYKGLTGVTLWDRVLPREEMAIVDNAEIVQILALNGVVLPLCGRVGRSQLKERRRC